MRTFVDVGSVGSVANGFVAALFRGGGPCLAGKQQTTAANQ